MKGRRRRKGKFTSFFGACSYPERDIDLIE